MNASNKLCTELIPVYREFKKFKQESYTGYKLVQKRNLNYYSVVTGMFRYKVGRIGHSSYSGLYEKNKEFYEERLLNRLSVFKDKEKAIKFLCKYNQLVDDNCELVLLEISISKDLEEAICFNKYCDDSEVVIGGSIDKIREVPLDLNFIQNFIQN